MTLVNNGHTNLGKALVALSVPVIPFQPVMMAGLHGLATEVSPRMSDRHPTLSVEHVWASATVSSETTL